jgi:hypothetical protein
MIARLCRCRRNNREKRLNRPERSSNNVPGIGISLDISLLTVVNFNFDGRKARCDELSIEKPGRIDRVSFDRADPATHSSYSIRPAYLFETTRVRHSNVISWFS